MQTKIGREINFNLTTTAIVVSSSGKQNKKKSERTIPPKFIFFCFKQIFTPNNLLYLILLLKQMLPKTFII